MRQSGAPPIVFVSDMKQAISFYRDVLGLPLKFESPGDRARDAARYRKAMVQMELSNGLRRSFFTEFSSSGGRRTTKTDFAKGRAR